jgi:hypothetical protein
MTFLWCDDRDRDRRDRDRVHDDGDLEKKMTVIEESSEFLIS